VTKEQQFVQLVCEFTLNLQKGEAFFLNAMQFYFRSSSRGRRPAPGQDQPVSVNGCSAELNALQTNFLLSFGTDSRIDGLSTRSLLYLR
jgi:hypothetical protein